MENGAEKVRFIKYEYRTNNDTNLFYETDTKDLFGCDESNL